VNNGQLCVKGRFCIPELVNNYQRLRMPYQTQYGTAVQMSWEKAVDLAAEKLSHCPPDDFAMLISPNCSNEDLYIAQKFTRLVMGSNQIDTGARAYYGSGFSAYVDLLRRSVPLSEVGKTSTILCIGLDAKYGRSVVGVELRRAIKKGAKVITIHPRSHSLSVISDQWFQPAPGKEVSLLNKLVKMTEEKMRAGTGKVKGKTVKAGSRLRRTADMLLSAGRAVILVGSEFSNDHDSPHIFRAVRQLAENIGAGIIPLPAQNNLLGSILMGVYPELLPGGEAVSNKKRLRALEKKWGSPLPDLAPEWTAASLASWKKLKVLYLIGEIPPKAENISDDLIFQNLYPPDPPSRADLVFPSAAFTETDGTFINGEGRVQQVKKAVHPPGQALPDWEILCRIARKMGKKGFDFSCVRDIQKEISSMVGHFRDFDTGERKARALVCGEGLKGPGAGAKGIKKTGGKFPFMLNTSLTEHVYRGLPLSRWVAGAEKLFAEGMVDINAEDAEKAGISEGNEVVVTSSGFERTWTARILREQPKGALHIILSQEESVGPNPHPVKIRKKDV
jgi:predicted molibdopterin-dependent oxidoreductase YjgC